MAIFENGFGLQAADVMDRARPGETLEITFTWRSDVNGPRGPGAILASRSRRERGMVGSTISSRWERVCLLGYGIVAWPTAKSGRYRCRLVLRPGDTTSLPGSIA